MVKARAYSLSSFNISVYSSSTPFMESKITLLRITQIRGFSSLSSSRATPGLVGGIGEKGLLPTQEAEQLSS